MSTHNDATTFQDLQIVLVEVRSVAMSIVAFFLICAPRSILRVSVGNMLYSLDLCCNLLMGALMVPIGYIDTPNVFG